MCSFYAISRPKIFYKGNILFYAICIFHIICISNIPAIFFIKVYIFITVTNTLAPNSSSSCSGGKNINYGEHNSLCNFGHVFSYLLCCIFLWFLCTPLNVVHNSSRRSDSVNLFIFRMCSCLLSCLDIEIESKIEKYMIQCS